MLYGCDMAALPKAVWGKRRVGCDAENKTASVVAVERKQDDGDLGLAYEKCKGGAVNAMVENDENEGVGVALRNGFWLNWNATNCTECETSGGRCGFDTNPDTYAFRCFCPDRPHAVQCDTITPPTAAGAKGLSVAGKTGIGLSVGLLSILMIVLFLHCKKKHSSSSDEFQTRSTYSTPSPDVEGGSVCFGVPLFSYKELEEATDRFDLNKQIGDGGFGIVYYDL